MMLITTYVLGFPTGRDFFVPQDKGTEVPSLSRDKGTTGQKSLLCSGTKGQWDKLKIFPKNRSGRDFEILSQDRPGRDFDSLSRPVLEYLRTVTGRKEKLQFLKK
jgi:hypothetical protein